jgi:hypothetical protein
MRGDGEGLGVNAGGVKGIILRVEGGYGQIPQCLGSMAIK